MNIVMVKRITNSVKLFKTLEFPRLFIYEFPRRGSLLSLFDLVAAGFLPACRSFPTFGSSTKLVDFIDKLSDLDASTPNERFKSWSLCCDATDSTWENNREEDNFGLDEWSTLLILDFVSSNDQEGWEESVSSLFLAYEDLSFDTFWKGFQAKC
jgi:hypothetical protein